MAGGSASPNVNFDDAYSGVLTGDFNGDGLTDFLILDNKNMNGQRWVLMLSKGDDGHGSIAFDMILGPIANTVTYQGETFNTYFKPCRAADWAGISTVDSAFGTTYGTLFAAVESGGARTNAFVMDVNHDGLSDYVWYVADKTDDTTATHAGWYAMISTGNFSESAAPGGPAGGFTGPIALTSLSAIGGASPFNTNSNYPYFVSTDVTQGIDYNGDGRGDLCTRGTQNGRPVSAGVVYTADPSNDFGDLVKSITDGIGRTTTVQYMAAKDDKIYTPGVAVSYPIREFRSSQPVVSEVTRDTGSSNPADVATYYYQYSGNRLDLSGRGSLGFHSFVTLDAQTNLFKYQFLTQSFPMTGLAAREQTYRYWTSGSTENYRLLSSHDNTVVFDQVVGGHSGLVFGTLYPFISKAVESRWEDATTPHFTITSTAPSSSAEQLFPESLPVNPYVTITAQSWFDNQDAGASPQLTLPGLTSYKPSDAVVANIVAGTLDPTIFNSLPRKITFGDLTQLKTDYGDGSSETVTNTYVPSSSDSGLNGLVQSTTTSETTSSFGTESGPTVSYTYWSNGASPTPLVSTTTTSTDGGTSGPLDFKIDTSARDSRGRVNNEVVDGYASSGTPQYIGNFTRLTVPSSGGYDANFDLPLLSKNAYGYSTQTTYDPVWGLPTAVTDVENNVTSHTTYDGVGRVTYRKDIYGVTTNVTYAFTSPSASGWQQTQTISCPTGTQNGVSGVSTYAVHTQTDQQPSVTSYYDRLGRVLRVVKEGFNSSSSNVDTCYNLLGQTVATSLPYAQGGTPQWTVTTYDALGRVWTVTTPNATLTTYTYNGRVTQKAVQYQINGATRTQTTTTLADAHGRTIAVWNPDNVPTGTIDPVTGPTTTPSVSYQLDGFGRMRKTTLLGQTQTVTATYDGLGNQTALSDPDKGSWTYLNNAFGQVVQQSDGSGIVTTSTFDQLGRPTTRVIQQGSAGTETSNWYYYDTSSHASSSVNTVPVGSNGWVGALQRDEVTTSGVPGYQAPATTNIHYYDAFGRPQIDLSTIDGKWYYAYSQYDSYNRLKERDYYWRPANFEAPGNEPYVWNNFGLVYSYDSKSYLNSITDTSGRTWWQVDPSSGYDFMDRAVLFATGSGYTTSRHFRPQDGLLDAIQTGTASGGSGVTPVIQNLSYGYDGLGNVTSRNDTLNTTTSETFDYDLDNRLVSETGLAPASYTYATNGNILTKTNVDGATNSPAYAYTGSQPHAVTSAWGYSLSYDGHGNVVSRTGNGDTWSFGWNGYDMPLWMAKNGVGNEFEYDAHHSRVMNLEFDAMASGAPSHYVRKRIYGLGSTLEANYTNSAASGAPVWSLNKVRLYVPGPDGVIGTIEFSPQASGPDTQAGYVYHDDNLGTIQCITPFGVGSATSGTFANNAANKPALYSYDPWGQRRNPVSGSGAPTSTAQGGSSDLTPRGFTGHEMLDGLGLVHMNGRIYDPLLGRFLSADIVVQAPFSLQSYNRYSYVMNNPLTLTDPSGFFWDPDSGFWGATEWKIFGKALVVGNANTAGFADSAVSSESAPAAMIVSEAPGSTNWNGGPTFMFGDQAQILQSQRAAAKEFGHAIVQAGRDGVTKVTGVADNNVQRRTAEVATDAATLVVGATKVLTDIAKATDGVAKASAKGEIAAEKALTPEDPIKPAEPYNRKVHYGNTPTQADRRAVGAGSGQVADHEPPLVQRYYEGDPTNGEKPGYQMTDAERKASASDRTRMKAQSRNDSNKQGAEMSKYSRAKRKEHFGDGN